jgi:DNA replication licensing factor MCM5
LCNATTTAPAEFLPLFERAAREVMAQFIIPTPKEGDVRHIQVTLRNFPNMTPIRQLVATDVAQLVCVQGIAVSAGKINIKATNLRVMCRNCKIPQTYPVNPGMGGVRLPRVCPTPYVPAR